MTDKPGNETSVDREVVQVELARLRLDRQNPRLVKQRDGASQEELAADLDAIYDAKEVAASIARFGYFPSEVLIGVEEDPGLITIVEGNRRLTAVLGLAEARYRSLFTDRPTWDRLAVEAAGAARNPARLPVLVATNREDAAAAIGYRHISGIKAWEPYQQARYVAERIDKVGLSITEVAQQCGIKDSEVREKYRNFKVVEAGVAAGVDLEMVQLSFGVWDAAMGRPTIRDYIGAPGPGQVVPGLSPIAEDKLESLREIAEWLFGTDVKPARISDSREITSLTKAMDHPHGLAALKAGKTLAEALEAARDAQLDPSDRFNHFMLTALNSLRNARALLADVTSNGITPSSINASVEDAEDELGRIRSTIEDW